MRFLSKSRNHVRVVRPAGYTWHGNTKVLADRGLQARFENHLLDTNAAQSRYGWNDADRKLVEDTLLGLPGLNSVVSGIYVEEEQGSVPGGPAAAEPSLRCIYTIQLPDGSEQCPRPARPGSDFCDEHYKVEAMAQVAASKEEEGLD